jgi:hypothetical protein
MGSQREELDNLMVSRIRSGNAARLYFCTPRAARSERESSDDDSRDKGEEQCRWDRAG